MIELGVGEIDIAPLCRAEIGGVRDLTPKRRHVVMEYGMRKVCPCEARSVEGRGSEAGTAEVCTTKVGSIK